MKLHPLREGTWKKLVHQVENFTQMMESFLSPQFIHDGFILITMTDRKIEELYVFIENNFLYFKQKW